MMHAIARRGYWVMVGVVTAIAAFFGYWIALNAFGPSTEYVLNSVQGASQRADGKFVAYLGDSVTVLATVKRHLRNGDCHLPIWRYGEEVGGPRDGKRHLLDWAYLRFTGKDEVLKVRWPLNGLKLGYDLKTKKEPGYTFPTPALDASGNRQPGEPLLAPGVDEQEYALLNVATYFCNPIDYLIPRYLQGGAKNETNRLFLIIKRNRP